MSDAAPGPFAGRRPARAEVLAVAAAAAVVFALQSAAWPIALGRDAAGYLIYYLDFASAEPALPTLMLFRTPAAPLYFGALLDLGGPLLVELAMGALFVAAVLAVHRLGARLGRAVGIGAAVAVLAWPPFGGLMHTVSSEALYAATLPPWALLCWRAIERPGAGRFALCGLAVFGLVMIRPASQLLLAFALVPALLGGLAWRERAKLALAFALPAVALLIGWSAVNAVRYGDFTVSRTGPAQLAFFRTYTLERIVRVENGPASARLGEAVRADLLTREPYRSYGVTLDDFFSHRSERAWGDLIALSDRRFGWDSDHAVLGDAAVEAIRTHPREYAIGVAQTLGAQVLRYPQRPAPAKAAPAPAPGGASGGVGAEAARVDPAPAPPRPHSAADLPGLPEGEIVPASNTWWLASTRDERIAFDWSGGPTAPRMTFRTPEQERHYAEIQDRLAALSAGLPQRDGSQPVAMALDGWGRLLPPPLVWILFGLAGLVLARGRVRLAVAVLLGASLGVLGVSALGHSAIAEYRIPFDPLLLVAAAAGISLVARRIGAARSARAGRSAAGAPA